MKSSRIDSADFVIKIAKILKVVAHPIRLQVLAALRKKSPLNVTEIAHQLTLDVERSLLSHHLIKMRDNGILSSKKEGMFVYYSIVDTQLFKILDCMESCEIV